MNTNNYKFCGAHRSQNSRVSFAAVVACALLVLNAGEVCRAQNPEVEKLLAAAKEKEAQAQKLRSDVGVFLQAATDYEAEAVGAEHQARFLQVRAMQLLKDVNKERAFTMRLSARQDWTEAQRKLVDARNTEVKAVQCGHNAEELAKAAAQVKDQPSIAATLEADARTQAAQAQTLAQAAAVGKVEAQRLDQRAATLWAQAEKLDPETHRQVAPRPPQVELRAVNRN